MKSKLMLQIKSRLRLAMLEEIDCRKNNITGDKLEAALGNKAVSRAIISMCPEVGFKPDQISDSDVTKLLKRYLKQEKVRMLYSAKFLIASDVEGKSSKEVSETEKQKMIELGGFLTNTKIKIVQDLLPEEISSDRIKKFILTYTGQNESDGKIIGLVMKHFKGGCDGNLVRSILKEMRDEA